MKRRAGFGHDDYEPRQVFADEELRAIYRYTDLPWQGGYYHTQTRGEEARAIRADEALDRFRQREQNIRWRDEQLPAFRMVIAVKAAEALLTACRRVRDPGHLWVREGPAPEEWEAVLVVRGRADAELLYRIVHRFFPVLGEVKAPFSELTREVEDHDLF